ncbi:hypothetical protein [Marinobacter sp.]|uniref:hypothetical protein n=1 Tax=Marinobacter sp. TaxID=50741 RepID=UPI000C90E705|nr:hypothetical protein [Marinobacter sp.]MAB53502.1 hypothetical protein [Marinobacter sp.]QDP47722.1 MAG: hypothetical protein Tp1102SUR657482_35 [Prokaryotic dsDNA virus sp.]|tara:strand:+ start:23684 stop:24406 length:723 start_codon:yes stop_codon:yes gene_type:complete
MQNSIIYQGPSLLDGSPIVVVALVKSSNKKTGDMVQTYIIRADMDPLKASKYGLDFAVCGDCKHRGEADPDGTGKQAKKRSCYVTLFHGPLQVYKSFKKGNYKPAGDISGLARGRMVRLGTYGDPAAVPSHIWDALLKDSAGHTGYTHQNNAPGADVRPDLTMISADSLQDAKIAWQSKRRTFRIITAVSDKQSNEILCPASEEAGRKAQCNTCKLCMGSHQTAPSIAIVAHGNGAAYIN